MKKSLYRTIVCIPLIIFALTGCVRQKSDVGNDENALVYTITTEPDHLDPFMAASADSRYVMFNVFEGLLKPMPDGSLMPAVAESYQTNDDYTEYTFILRDILFHNGQKVTADDVVYSINQAVAYKMNGMDAVRSATASDERTVVIKLTAPDSEFYYNLTTAIVPAEYENLNTHPIGTGPFKFSSFTPQQELVLVKNDSYWQDGLPKIDKIIFKIKADFKAALLDLQAGSANSGFFDATSALQVDVNRFDVVYDNSNSVQMLALNNAFEPFQDIRVRQAFCYALDIDEIIQLAHNGHAVRAASPVIPGLKKMYNTDLDSLYSVDLERAKELLSESGYVDGFELTITVPSSYQMHIDTAQIIVNQLARIGVTARIQQVDWSSWLSDVYQGRRYEATVISVDGTTLSPRSYLARYVSDSPSNFINYNNPEYDRLFAQVLEAGKEDTHMLLNKELQKIISHDAGAVFICDMAVPKIYKKGIKGYISYPLYIFDAAPIYFE